MLYRALTKSGITQDGTIKSGIALSANIDVVAKLGVTTALQLVTEVDITAVEPSELELVTPTSNAIYNSNCDCDFPLKGEEETDYK